MAPVFWFTRPKLGGYGFSPLEISLFLGSAGISQALWILVVFPPLQHRFGSGAVLRACSILWPITFLIYPLCSVFLRHDLKVTFWIVASITVVVSSGVSMAFSKSCPVRSRYPSLIEVAYLRH